MTIAGSTMHPTPMMDGTLYRRLCRARDFAASHYARAVTVDMMAREACLSPWHFHRLFAAAFGQTTHEFLSSLRLQRAKRLLAASDISVTEICLETGFVSLGSFSSWFRARAGLAPSTYRRELTRVFGVSVPWRHTFVPTCFLSVFGAAK